MTYLQTAIKIFNLINKIAGLIVFPSYLLHEGAHYIAAKILEIKIDRVCLFNTDTNSPISAYIEVTVPDDIKLSKIALFCFAPQLLVLPLFLFSKGFDLQYHNFYTMLMMAFTFCAMIPSLGDVMAVIKVWKIQKTLN